MAGWTMVVEKLAPTISICLGGPLAISAVSQIEKVFGITPAPAASMDDRRTKIADAISAATSEQFIALRKADQDYAASMVAAGFKDLDALASLVIKEIDKTSVTAPAIESVVPAVRSKMPPLFTIVVTIGFFGLLLLLLFVNVPEANKPILFSFTGTLGTVWVATAHFWFGDNHESGRKSDLLAQSSQALSN